MPCAVAGVSCQAEERPGAHVAEHEKRDQPPGVPPLPYHPGEHIDQRQAGGEHHGEGHERPAGDEGDGDEQAAGGETEVRLPELFMAEVLAVRRLSPGEEDDPGKHYRPQQEGQEVGPVIDARG